MDYLRSLLHPHTLRISTDVMFEINRICGDEVRVVISTIDDKDKRMWLSEGEAAHITLTITERPER